MVKWLRGGEKDHDNTLQPKNAEGKNDDDEDYDGDDHDDDDDTENIQLSYVTQWQAWLDRLDRSNTNYTYRLILTTISDFWKSYLHQTYQIYSTEDIAKCDWETQLQY